MPTISHLRLAFLHPRNKRNPAPVSWRRARETNRLSPHDCRDRRFNERLLPASVTAFTAAWVLAKDRRHFAGVDIEAYLTKAVGLELDLAGHVVVTRQLDRIRRPLAFVLVGQRIGAVLVREAGGHSLIGVGANKQDLGIGGYLAAR